MGDHQGFFHEALKRLIPYPEPINAFINSLQKKRKINTADDTKHRSS